MAIKLDPTKTYSMPLIMGPLFDQDVRPGRVYGQVETLSATFKTEPQPIRELIPECFVIPDEPTVTFTFGDHNHVDFMAGDGYRVAYAGVSARFQGKEEVGGLCVLVMWENRTVPIITGRELIGMPKMHADITAIRATADGVLRATAAVWGHEVMRLEVVGAKEQNVVVRRTAQKRVNTVPWLGYKYIPSFDGPPDASYPMVVWNEATLDHLELGESGSVSFGSADDSDLGQLAAIPEALRTLPLGDLVFASHVRGSAVLSLPRSHRLV